jgi:hypothetical protein
MRFFSQILLALLLIVFSNCSGTNNSETAFYVSLSGNDSWSGTLPEPDSGMTDGPFATLGKARNALRVAKNDPSSKSGAYTIYIRGGSYQLTNTLELSKEDSGTADSPVTWRAYPGENVHFIGGNVIDGFEPVSNPAVLKRIDRSFHGKIVKANLTHSGIPDFGEIDPTSGKRLELFFKHKFMTIARYPNEGWLTVADVPQTGPKRIHEGLDRDKSTVPRGRHYGRMTYSGDRPDKWAESDNIWVHGYWAWDWADEYLRLAKIDTSKRDIYPAEPHHGYGYKKDQRFYFLNILEELDTPGEWYLDSEDGDLYFWPPEPLTDGDAVVSVMEDTMVSLDETSCITIRGIVFEASRGGAVTIRGGADNTLAGCTFRNLGMTAVKINGGTNNGVLSCDMYDIASGGVDLHGGDLATLTPAGNYAVNNHIHDFGIRIKTYQPAVQTTGVGNRIAHNLIHDAPHTGIFLTTSNVGNDHIIEYNELHSLAKETGDVGAIYLCARNYTFRGTVIRHNYVHHLFGPGLHGVMGVYLDDFTSGTTVYGNVFYKAGRASFVGGGRDNTIENNIYVECAPSTHVDARGIGWAKYYFNDNTANFIRLMEERNYREPPYSEKYPELLTLLDDDPAIPKNNTIVRNVSYGGTWLNLVNGMDFETVSVRDNYISDPVLHTWRSNDDSENLTYENGDRKMTEILEANGNTVTDTDPGFVDAENENFMLKEDSPAYGLGFKRIPFEDIGLYIDEFRTTLNKKAE